MFHLNKKFVAVLLAIWLPLFSGNALAASVAMQSMGNDCPVAAQANEHASSHLSTVSHHDQFAAGQDPAAAQHDQQDSFCKDCGVCHFACSGYLATVDIKVTEARLPARTYATSSTQFKSYTSAPLDPPPFSRV
jgi:hypothetical protein